MNVQISKKAELFFKALEDIWSAEQLQRGCANNAVWHCTQAAEKILKGVLFCYGKAFENDHEFSSLLIAVEEVITLPQEITIYINYFNRFGSGLRYKNMANDPTVDDARTAISRAKQIMQEFTKYPKTSEFIEEAEEVHIKMLKNLLAD